MATKSNLIIDQGADYSTTIEIRDDNGASVDITGFSANAMIRKAFSSSNTVAFQTTVDGVNGTITLSLPASNSAAMAAGRYVYDVVTTDLVAKKSRVVEGIVTIAASVTR